MRKDLRACWFIAADRSFKKSPQKERSQVGIVAAKYLAWQMRPPKKSYKKAVVIFQYELSPHLSESNNTVRSFFSRATIWVKEIG